VSVIWPALTAAAPEEERLYSLKQNQKIQADRHIFYVEQIVRQLLLIVLQRRALRAMNLCPPCCALSYGQAPLIKRDLFGPVEFFFDHKGPGTNEGHVSTQDVIELREFIES